MMVSMTISDLPPDGLGSPANTGQPPAWQWTPPWPGTDWGGPQWQPPTPEPPRRRHRGLASFGVRVGGVGASHSAHVVRTDVADDIALLQIDNVSGLHTIQVGDSSSVSVGDLVVALGNALGRGGVPAVSQGRVTNLNQTITASDQGGGNAETLNGLIEINAPIQPGDSGGPLVDTSGRVVGMDTAASE